ncbi:hypothetical protein OPT61_g255 [Boeremia exigua]|uniref:Uncharacterized protein n=1 Tax=Boeremia exigua TaxID=749465 RepID=A0ACC2IUV9_9PLEO|nr:hypothetical protein OPT61_g255 [Boeremia exigua]
MPGLFIKSLLTAKQITAKTTIREVEQVASLLLTLAPAAPPHGRKQLVAASHAEAFDSRSVNVLPAKPTQAKHKKVKES